MVISMQITYLGQAGLLFEKNGLMVMVDPYLSNSVEKINPKNYRRVPVDERFLKVTPNVLVLTHDHLDHTDPETLEILLKTDKQITVLAPYEAWKNVRQYGGNHNYVLFDRGIEWTENAVLFRAVKAVHSDLTAIGAVIEWGGITYYITGDTLYSEEVFLDIPGGADVLFLPVNGTGNNMNMTDAARFSTRVGAKTVIPYHFGMFDNIDPRELECKNKVIPKIFEVIKLG